MTEPILDPTYWKRRLAQAGTMVHHSIFKCSLDTWLAIECRHQEILQKYIAPTTSVLDCGCGYGRLLTLLPNDWHGTYHGIDISPDFVDVARSTYPGRVFHVGDLQDLWFLRHNGQGKFDWAVLISIRPMVRRNLGEDVWDIMQQQIKSVAQHLLFLEYDVNDKGEVL